MSRDPAQHTPPPPTTHLYFTPVAGEPITTQLAPYLHRLISIVLLAQQLQETPLSSTAEHINGYALILNTTDPITQGTQINSANLHGFIIRADLGEYAILNSIFIIETIMESIHKDNPEDEKPIYIVDIEPTSNALQYRSLMTANTLRDLLIELVTTKLKQSQFYTHWSVANFYQQSSPDEAIKDAAQYMMTELDSLASSSQSLPSPLSTKPLRDHLPQDATGYLLMLRDPISETLHSSLESLAFDYYSYHRDMRENLQHILDHQIPFAFISDHPAEKVPVELVDISGVILNKHFTDSPLGFFIVAGLIEKISIQRQEHKYPPVEIFICGPEEKIAHYQADHTANQYLFSEGLLQLCLSPAMREFYKLYKPSDEKLFAVVHYLNQALPQPTADRKKIIQHRKRKASDDDDLATLSESPGSDTLSETPSLDKVSKSPAQPSKRQRKTKSSTLSKNTRKIYRQILEEITNRTQTKIENTDSLIKAFLDQIDKVPQENLEEIKTLTSLLIYTIHTSINTDKTNALKEIVLTLDKTWLDSELSLFMLLQYPELASTHPKLLATSRRSELCKSPHYFLPAIITKWCSDYPNSTLSDYIKLLSISDPDWDQSKKTLDDLLSHIASKQENLSYKLYAVLNLSLTAVTKMVTERPENAANYNEIAQHLERIIVVYNQEIKSTASQRSPRLFGTPKGPASAEQHSPEKSNRASYC